MKGAKEMSELSHYIKLRSSLSGCNAKQFECDKYLDCDSCLEDKIKEHDKQIRAEVIDSINDNIHEIYKCQFYCMEDMCEHDNPTVDMCIDCFYDAIQKSLEQLKEQKK